MELLGISLTDVGIKEALNRTKEYLETGGLNTIAYVSTRKLLEACGDEEQQKWWNELDLTVCEDTEVLKAVGNHDESRQREVEDNIYLTEFLRLLAERNKDVFLLTQREEQLEGLKEELSVFGKDFYGQLSISEGDCLDSYTDNTEGLINRINLAAPAVIISQLPYPKGIRLMHDCHSYLNSRLWLTLPEVLMKEERTGLPGKVASYFYSKLFDKKIQQFEQEKE